MLINVSLYFYLVFFSIYNKFDLINLMIGKQSSVQQSYTCKQVSAFMLMLMEVMKESFLLICVSLFRFRRQRERQTGDISERDRKQMWRKGNQVRWQRKIEKMDGKEGRTIGEIGCTNCQKVKKVKSVFNP